MSREAGERLHKHYGHAGCWCGYPIRKEEISRVQERMKSHMDADIPIQPTKTLRSLLLMRRLIRAAQERDIAGATTQTRVIAAAHTGCVDLGSGFPRLSPSHN